MSEAQLEEKQESLAEIKTGDLVFYKEAGARSNEWIEAPGTVVEVKGKKVKVKPAPTYGDEDVEVETKEIRPRVKGQRGKIWEEKIAEAHELITPVMIGTPEERLEALNLWAGVVTSLKKISELPSTENRTSLLRAAQTEAQCALDRVVNIVHVPVAAPAPTVAPSVPSMAYESQEEFPSEVTAERLCELAGIQRRAL